MTSIPSQPNADTAWANWVRTNLQAGCDPVDLQRDMRAAGWSQDASDALIVAQGRELFPALFGSPDAIPLPLVPQAGVIDVDGRTVEVVMSLAHPAVALCNNVLSGAECDALLAFAEVRGLVPSTVIDERSGAAIPHPERTSLGLMLGRGETELVASIERRLSALTHWPINHGEGLQLLRYRIGDEYRPHYDAFPAGPAGDIHRGQGGQRVNTVLVYLQSPEQGGATCFPGSGLAIRPAKGSALVFRNVTADGNLEPASLHAGLPVLAGEKTILTLWQRERAF